ncbi:MAG: type IA DNA topoisomerase [Acidobacteria bacterium]|nr:type IA DNA topoisomerase [Acidobacteriota bacterium]
MPRVIIAEKPSVARDIAAALGWPEKEDGLLRVGDTVVTWAIGHLYEIEENGDRWDLDELPLLPAEFRYRASEGKEKQAGIIRELLQGADEVVNACDAGREGELIFRLAVENAGYGGPVKRLWTSEALSVDVVRRELSDLKPGDGFESLYRAALARQHADWLVGVNLTRLLTLRAADRTVWSAGRVQTPVLRLIVDREEEIRDFQPVPFWKIRVDFVKDGSAFSGWISDGAGEMKFFDPAVAEKALTDVTAAGEGLVRNVSTERKEQFPPALHSLTSLQREANERLGLTAGRTLELAQELYEAKLVSYPRTDAGHLDESPQTREMVRRLLGELGHPELCAAVETAGRRVFDNAKLTDHYALVPQKRFPDNAVMADEHRMLYELIERRFLGAFMESCLCDWTTVDLDVGTHPARAVGNAEVREGWKALYRKEVEEKGEDGEGEGAAQRLPDLEAGERVPRTGVERQGRKTAPPKRYTESALLGAMERLGLGTPATRAAVIERLKRVQYVGLVKKAIQPTAKAGELIGKLRGRPVADPETTGRWETELEGIYRKNLGREGYGAFMDGIRKAIVEEVRELKGLSIEARAGDVGTCRCGGRIEELPKTFVCAACRSLVWKEFCGRKLTRKQAAALLGGKRVDLKKLRSRAGKEFDAAAEFDVEQRKVRLVFR